jgi:hypothetical protein
MNARWRAAVRSATAIVLSPLLAHGREPGLTRVDGAVREKLGLP